MLVVVNTGVGIFTVVGVARGVTRITRRVALLHLVLRSTGVIRYGSVGGGCIGYLGHRGSASAVIRCGGGGICGDRGRMGCSNNRPVAAAGGCNVVINRVVH